ncbi:Metallo-dependent phosphatase [Flagelloscypha sp. PMI_526]|nr:Metallo-dependent phosphatase [Flagelloscypha sp. PMI_526]
MSFLSSLIPSLVTSTPKSGNFKTANAHVYASYSSSKPLPSVPAGFTRFVCISDTHSRYFEIPPGDILLHAGDLTTMGYVGQVKESLEWLRGLPHPVKVVIAGNHDMCLDETISSTEQLVGGEEDDDDTPMEEMMKEFTSSEAKSKGFHYLQFESTTIKSPRSGRQWDIWGSPATPKKGKGAFTYPPNSNAARDIYAKIPSQTDIFLTHTPPFGMLDKKRQKGSPSLGCPILQEQLDSLDNMCLHVFGHIHQAHGTQLVTSGRGQHIAVNAAMMEEGIAVVIDLKD